MAFMKSLKVLAVGTALAFGCTAGSAAAAEIVGACNALTDLSVQASECAGWYGGNLLNNAHVAEQTAALSLIGLNWDGNWGTVDLTKVNAGGSGQNVFDFNGALDGDVWIGIHKGKGGKDGFEGTGFFRLTASDLDAVSLNLKGASSAVVYAQHSAVPEPGTWAMLLVGFGAMGAAMRKRKLATPRVSLAR
jgi:hypothetical protein